MSEGKVNNTCANHGAMVMVPPASSRLKHGPVEADLGSSLLCLALQLVSGASQFTQNVQ